MEKLVLSIKETAEVLGISESLLYNEIRKNPEFPRKRVGNRILIPVNRLEEYMNATL